MADVAAAEAAPIDAPVEAPVAEAPVVDAPAAGDAAPPEGTPGGEVIWPENWRERMAGDDEKKLTRLGRFAEPAAVFNSYLELEQTHQNSDIRAPFPAEGTDSEKAVWREQNAIPKDAAGYFESLPEGLVVGEEDKPGMDALAEAMHAANASTSSTHTAMGVYYEQLKAANAQRAEDDAQDLKNYEDGANELYQGDYRGNINRLKTWLEAGGDEVHNKFLNARTPDGTLLGNDPDVMKFLVGEMLKYDPIQTTPGLGAGDPVVALHDEIAAIEKTMKTEYKTYQADEAMQARYEVLLAARARHEG